MVDLPTREAFFNRDPAAVAQELSSVWVSFDDVHKNEYKGDGKVILVPSSESEGLYRYFLLHQAAVYSDEWTKKKFPGSSKQKGRAQQLEETSPGGIRIFRFMMSAQLPFVKTVNAANIGFTMLHELNATGQVIDRLSPTKFVKENGLSPETRGTLEPTELRGVLAFRLNRILTP